jgi:hypothetical protein
MRDHLRWTVVALVIPAILLGGAGLVLAVTGIPGANGVIYACFQTQTGNLRVVPEGTKCRDSETALFWNQVGPQGPKGEKGDQGIQGEKGPKGDTGATGPQGPAGSTLSSFDALAGLRCTANATLGRIQITYDAAARATFTCVSPAWSMSGALAAGRWGLDAVAIGSAIYAVGGSEAYPDCTYSSRVERFDTTTGASTGLASLGTNRNMPGVVALGGMIYAFGGHNGCGSNLSSMEMYDPATNTWSARASMTRQRGQAPGVLVNGRIYALGGDARASCADPETVESYDLVANVWTLGATIPLPGCYSVKGSAARGGVIYAIAADPSAAGNPWQILVFDPTSSTWSMRGPGPNAINPIATRAVAIDEHIVFQDSNVVRAYNVVTDTWATIAPPVVPSIGAALVFNNGSLYLIGGLTAPANCTAGDTLTNGGATCIKRTVWSSTP